MNNITQPLAPRLASPSLPDFVSYLTRIDIYLYRDPLPRPAPYAYRPAPEAPYGPFSPTPSAFVGKASVCFLVDRASLRAPHPLHFHAILLGFVLHPLGFARYYFTGGGGTACPAGDARTLEALVAALRCFPDGWQIGCGVNDTDELVFPPERD